MSETGLLEGWSLEGLKTAVSKLVVQVGYSAGPLESSHDGFFFLASRQEPLGVVKTLIYVCASGKIVSQHGVSDVLKLARRKEVSKVVLFSLHGFSESAAKFSAIHGIDIFDGKGLEELLEKYVISTPKKEKIFEYAFDLGVTMSEATRVFERERGKKFLGFGVDERIVGVSGRYAPVGSFLLTRSEEVKTGLSRTLKNVKKSNFFYVNLHTNELCYISRGLGKGVKMASSNILNRLMYLTLGSVEMLADIVKKGVMEMGEMHERYELFYEDNRNDLQLLWEEGLIATTTDRRGFMPNLTIPAFDNPRYNVRGFTSIARSVPSSFEVDSLKFEPKDVVKLLEVFFAAKGEVREVIYLPYYSCRYVDDRGMSRSKVLLAPKYLV